MTEEGVTGGYTESGTSWPDDRGGGYRGLHGVGD